MFSASEIDYRPFLTEVMRPRGKISSPESLTVDCRDSSGRTPLMYAVLVGGAALDVASDLISYGADPRLLDKFGVSAQNMAEKASPLYIILAEASVALTVKAHNDWARTIDSQMSAASDLR